MLKDAEAFSSFSVDDVPKAKQFYAEILGLDVEEDNRMDSTFLNINLGSGTSIMVYPKPDHQPATFTILNFKVDDIEETVEELAGKGVEFEQYDNEWVKTDAKGIARDDEGKGPAIAWFKDPAGNVMAVMEDK